MRIELYHEVDPNLVEKVLQQGIRRGSEGEKTDPQKKKIDTFLDTHAPDWIKWQRLSRADAIYAYLSDGDKIIDITDGQSVTFDKFLAKTTDTLLCLMVDSDYCFVSDLDLYDTIVRAMELDEQDSTREHLADRYWRRIIPLDKYEPGTFKRPEVMINTDIAPQDIEVVSD
jgi:hypothetical protein